MASEQTRDVARVFDGWAREDRDEGMAKRHLLTAEPVLERMPVEAGMRWLDLGTGNGWAARYAAAQGADPVGVDAARSMLTKARAFEPRVPLVQADFTALPFPPAAFQAAFSMEALYYADDVVAALEEAHRVLAPGGSLHALIDYYEENEASHGWPEQTGVAMQLISEAGWTAAFEQAGFTEVGTDRILSTDPATAGWKAEHGSLYVHGTR